MDTNINTERSPAIASIQRPEVAVVSPRHRGVDEVGVGAGAGSGPGAGTGSGTVTVTGNEKKGYYTNTVFFVMYIFTQ